MSSRTEELLAGQESLASEIARRRTFAIISHPDAGKTTLTEKLLLYAGAIELAGAVRGSKTQRHAVSDWMELEQQRGISISAAALEFELEGHHVTLLDTPGHQDFSEDTYRTLLAVDSVVMVLDAAKGVEPQTLKLFEVCRSRGLPVLTFINKLDQPARDPFELLDEIERVLGLSAEAAFWQLLSLPSLFLALLAALGYFSGFAGHSTLDEVQQNLLNGFSRAFSHQVVDQLIAPLVHNVLQGGRADVL